MAFRAAVIDIGVIKSIIDEKINSHIGEQILVTFQREDSIDEMIFAKEDESEGLVPNIRTQIINDHNLGILKENATIEKNQIILPMDFYAHEEIGSWTLENGPILIPRYYLMNFNNEILPSCDENSYEKGVLLDIGNDEVISKVLKNTFLRNNLNKKGYFQALNLLNLEVPDKLEDDYRNLAEELYYKLIFLDSINSVSEYYKNNIGTFPKKEYAEKEIKNNLEAALKFGMHNQKVSLYVPHEIYVPEFMERMCIKYEMPIQKSSQKILS